MIGTRSEPMLIKILGREFDEDKINPSHKDFDKSYMQDYENYLVSIPETEAVKIPISHAYKRIKIISAREQPALLAQAGYVPNKQRIQRSDEPQRINSLRSTKVYKNWAHDS